MKKILKTVLFYDKIYPIVKSSMFYHAWKKWNAQIAKLMNNNPSKDFFIVGVTGTNGKTTTVNLLHTLLNSLLAKTITISTESIRIGEKRIHNDKKMTSLDIFDLQSTLAKAKDAGCKVAVLEVSSQGIDQQRFDGITFDYAVLTNITRDHLDYHKTMDNYASTKKKLFSSVLRNNKNNKFGSFPLDDKFGKNWYENFSFDKKISYSITMNSTLKANNIEETLTGTTFTVSYLGRDFQVQSPLLGVHNVYNFLAALSVGINIGLDVEQCIHALQRTETIPGRLEKIVYHDVNYFVDFAHTPDGLDKTLTYLKHIKGNGRIITVFGAPGNRDKDKRPEMGEIAYKHSDILIATDDDADTENRLQILKGLSKNIDTEFSNEKDFFIIPERKFAIKFATDIVRPGDIVLLAGKGHETVQITNQGKRPWSDRKVLTYYLSKKQK